MLNETPHRNPLSVVARPAFANRERNPYQSLLYSALAKRGVAVADLSVRALRHPPAIFHMHWPDLIPARRSLIFALARTLLYVSLISFLKLRGTRVVWTVHNLKPHEAYHPRLSDWFLTWVRRRVDGLVFLSQANERAARDVFPELPRIPAVIAPIGDYRDVYPAPPHREEAKAALGLSGDARVVLFFGLLRPFKQVEALIRAARELVDRELTVLVAGKADDSAYLARLKAAAGDDPRIRLMPGFVPHERVSLLFGACDLVVLPFRDVTNSSSVVLAVSMDRPVLAPRQGSLPELAAAVGGEWVRLYDGALDAQTLAGALRWANTPDRPGRADLSALDWDSIAERTEELYRAIVAVE